MIDWIKCKLTYLKYYSKYGWKGFCWYETDDGRILWKYIGNAPIELKGKKEAQQWFFDKARKSVSSCRHYSQPDELAKRSKPKKRENILC